MEAYLASIPHKSLFDGRSLYSIIFANKTSKNSNSKKGYVYKRSSAAHQTWFASFSHRHSKPLQMYMYIVNCIPHNTDNIDIIASNLTTLYKKNNNNFLLSHCNKCHDRDEKSAPETCEMDVALIVFSPGQSRSITYKKKYHICYIWEGMVLETWQ